jgi:hypothetical protein
LIWLIQEQDALGITPVIWKDEDEARAAGYQGRSMFHTGQADSP